MPFCHDTTHRAHRRVRSTSDDLWTTNDQSTHREMAETRGFGRRRAPRALRGHVGDTSPGLRGCGAWCSLVSANSQQRPLSSLSIMYVTWTHPAEARSKTQGSLDPSGASVGRGDHVNHQHPPPLTEQCSPPTPALLDILAPTPYQSSKSAVPVTGPSEGPGGSPPVHGPAA